VSSHLPPKLHMHNHSVSSTVSVTSAYRVECNNDAKSFRNSKAIPSCPSQLAPTLPLLPVIELWRPPSFKTLADNTNQIVSDFQRDLKAELKSVAVLELDSFLQQIGDTACQAIKDFSDIMFIEAHHPTSGDLKDSQTLIHACIIQNQSMFEYLSTDPQTFWSKYLAHHYPDDQCRIVQLELSEHDRALLTPFS
jgi:hypothetical protein